MIACETHGIVPADDIDRTIGRIEESRRDAARDCAGQPPAAVRADDDPLGAFGARGIDQAGHRVAVPDQDLGRHPCDSGPVDDGRGILFASCPGLIDPLEEPTTG